MRIWFDAAGMRDLLFLEAMATRSGRRHDVLLTVPGDTSALAAARARGIAARAAGRGAPGPGAGARAALDAKIGRIRALARAVPRFGPDLAVSLSSAEAARVTHGLGIDHVAFGDIPAGPGGDDAVRRTASLVQKMIVPWLAPAAPFLRRGLAAADLIRFRGTIESTTARRRPGGLSRKGVKSGMPAPGSVLVRPPAGGWDDRPDPARWTAEAAGAAAEAAGAQDRVAVIARRGQSEALRAALGPLRACIVDGDGRHDGMLLLGRCRALVGAGGSAMISEAALSGVPAVSYGGRPGAAERHLERLGLVARARSAGGVRARVAGLLRGGGGRGGGGGGAAAAAAARTALKSKARAEMSLMEDPFPVLAAAARALGKPL